MNMKESMGFSKVLIVALTVALVVMSVGYASFSAKLNVVGTTTVGASSWSVKFIDTSYSESTGSVTAVGKTIKDDSFEYTINLSKPGDYYEATLNISNSGTFDAKMTGITMTALTSAQQKYLVYEVYYNGTKYTASTLEDFQAIELKSGETVPVKVKVQYIQPSLSTELPSEAQEITLNASFDFAQAV